MEFHSILFENLESGRNVDSEESPEFFKDLNLDQVVQAITEGWKDYNLAPFFYVRLHELDAISYRQEVMRDFECARLMEAVKSFSAQMRAMRERLKQAKDLYFKYAIERGFVGIGGARYFQACTPSFYNSEQQAIDRRFITIGHPPFPKSSP